MQNSLRIHEEGDRTQRLNWEIPVQISVTDNFLGHLDQSNPSPGKGNSCLKSVAVLYFLNISQNLLHAATTAVDQAAVHWVHQEEESISDSLVEALTSYWWFRWL